MGRILVVDDEPYATRMLKLRLEGEGHRVEVASDGEEALEKLRLQSFDLLITDIQMPRMDGRELCRQLRAEHPDGDPPIFVVTSRPEDEHRVWAGELSGVEFLEKPLSLRRLAERVHQKLNGEGGDGGEAP